MRLPWPFRRTPPPTPAASSGTGVEGPVLPAGRAEWRELPPLESSLREAPLMAPPRRFNAGLAGSQLPPPILEPLGHEVSAGGPQGLVMGTVTPSLAGPGVARRGPTAATGATASLGLRRPARVTVQRAADDAPDAFEEPATPQGDAFPSAGALPPVQRALAPAAPVAGPLPVRRSMVDASHQLAPTPRELALSKAAPEPMPARRSAAGEAADEAADVPRRTLERSLAGVRRVRLGPPIASPAAIPPAASPRTSTPAVPGLQRAPQSDIPDARRPAPSEGRPLQAPIVLRPRVRRGADDSTERALRDDLRMPLGLALPARQAIEAPSTGGPSMDAGPAAHTAAGPAEPAGARPDASSPNELPPADHSDATRALSMPVVARLLAAADHGPLNVAPLASRRALRAAGAGPSRSAAHAARAAEQPVAQRAITSAGVGQVGQAAPMPGGPSSGPVPVRRGEMAARMAEGSGVRGATIDGTVHLPTAAGALDGGTGRAVLAHEVTHVLQQRRLGDAMPPAGSESRHQLEREARDAEAWSLWTDLALPPTLAAGPLAAGPAGAGGIASSADEAADAHSVPTARLGGADAGRVPMLDSTAARSSTTVIQGAEGDAPPPAAPAAAAAEPAAMSDRDVETLLRRLYPRLRHYLADELLVARERAGRLADLG